MAPELPDLETYRTRLRAWVALVKSGWQYMGLAVMSFSLALTVKPNLLSDAPFIVPEKRLLWGVVAIAGFLFTHVMLSGKIVRDIAAGIAAATEKLEQRERERDKEHAKALAAVQTELERARHEEGMFHARITEDEQLQERGNEQFGIHVTARIENEGLVFRVTLRNRSHRALITHSLMVEFLGTHQPLCLDERFFPHIQSEPAVLEARFSLPSALSPTANIHIVGSVTINRTRWERIYASYNKIPIEGQASPPNAPSNH